MREGQDYRAYRAEGKKSDWSRLLTVANSAVAVAVDAGQAVKVLCLLADLLWQNRLDDYCTIRGEDLVGALDCGM